jgi:phage gp36-like protein
MAYATRADVEQVYGADNVRKWADLDNRGSTADVDARVLWALNLATARMNAHLLGGVYTVPFVTPYDLLVIDANARLAGLLLYQARGITDETVSDVLRRSRDEYFRVVRSIRSGRLTLAGLTAANSHPAAATDYASEEVDYDGILDIL